MTAAENSLEQTGQPHSVCRPRASLWFQRCRKAFDGVWQHADDLAEAPRRNITRRHDMTQPSKAPPTTTNIQNNQCWPQQNSHI
ncbi:uncharacterized protein DMAD_03203 [Drosophila madeirensis]|uniref:Uncharacterized protein n=1 Tax=Drosophila madeirensis TaxID=30013 RepID=A0AAU9G7W6_DROMD